MGALPAHIFRAYDVRGRAGAELTADVADRIGQGYASYLRARHRLDAAVVGRDNRPSSAHLQAAFVAGARRAGLSMIDIGEAPSPLVYFAAARWGVGGVAVTASHNPAPDNGFKLLEADAIPLGPEQIQDLRRSAEAAPPAAAGAQLQGSLEQRDARGPYLAMLAGRFRLSRGLRVAVDPGNGVATLTGPDALAGIGAKVSGVHRRSDGSFPNHPPDPAHPRAIAALRGAVRAAGADVGFGWDGDGDRLSLVDEGGRHHTADAVLAVLARDLLTRHPGAVVLVDVKISLAVLEAIAAAGGRAHFTQTGHSLIKRRMRADGVLLAGEGSGHYYFAEDYYGLDDAVYAACALAQIVARSGEPASALFRDLPRYVTSPEISIPCPDDRKHALAADLATQLRAEYPINDTDGARVDFGDGWGLVRASNTTPHLKLRMEGRTADAYAIVRDQLTGHLRRHPELGDVAGALQVDPDTPLSEGVAS